MGEAERRHIKPYRCKWLTGVGGGGGEGEGGAVGEGVREHTLCAGPY